MWDTWSFGVRKHGAAGCWSAYGGREFFEQAYSGESCQRQWSIAAGSFTSDAPALMGYGPSILEFCLSRRGVHQRVWFAKNEQLALECLRSSQNVLRVPQREWNVRRSPLALLHHPTPPFRRNRASRTTRRHRFEPPQVCVNFNWLACAARGQLPGQGSTLIHFATPPGRLDVADLQGAAMDGYKMEDVYYLELCVLNELCENGDDIFASNEWSEGFHCQTSRERFEAFGALMMGMD